MEKAWNDSNQKEAARKLAPKIQRKDSSVNMAEKVSSWTEEETALVLKVALEHKTAKVAEGKNWQTIRAK